MHVGGLRNITADGPGVEVDVPKISDVRQWMHTDPALFAFVTVITFFAACYINSAALGNLWRVRRVFRSVAEHAARHVGVIVAFIFIGFVLSRADAISDSEVVQFQKFVASHQDQPVVMNYFRVASQLSANWTNTVILPDYDRIDILINAEAGDDKGSWSVFDTGAFRHVVNDSRCVVPGSIRPCNISVRGVFGGSGKPPKYMCDAIDTVQTQSGTAELLMQDALMHYNRPSLGSGPNPSSCLGSELLGSDPSLGSCFRAPDRVSEPLRASETLRASVSEPLRASDPSLGRYMRDNHSSEARTHFSEARTQARK